MVEVNTAESSPSSLAADSCGERGTGCLVISDHCSFRLMDALFDRGTRVRMRTEEKRHGYVTGKYNNARNRTVLVLAAKCNGKDLKKPELNMNRLLQYTAHVPIYVTSLLHGSESLFTAPLQHDCRLKGSQCESMCVHTHLCLAEQS